MNAKNIPRATHGGPGKELHIGEVNIPCYVLEDGRRVLSQRGMVDALGMSRGSAGDGGDRLTNFASGKAVSPYMGKLLDAVSTPMQFRTTSGSVANGYEATVLADFCDALLDARKAGVLQKQQLHIAEQAEMLVRAFARIGIVALVDEATGYQAERDRDALHKLLEKYLSAEKLKWAKTFPDEFYKQIYRLWQWPWPNSGRRTPEVGKITNRLVYDKLPTGVHAALREKNPRDPETGNRQWKHHQFLSEDLGRPDLRDHLLQVIILMRSSPNRSAFERAFARAFPSPDGVQMEIDGIDESDDDEENNRDNGATRC